MGVGATFDTTYTATSSEQVLLTAWGTVSDQFNIYVNGIERLSSTVVPNWDALGWGSAIDTDFADYTAVYTSGLFSTADFFVGKGDVIWIQVSSLAPDDGSVYSDGTFGAVAIEALNTPEPATFGFMAVALLALGGLLLRRTMLSREGI